MNRATAEEALIISGRVEVLLLAGAFSEVNRFVKAATDEIRQRTQTSDLKEYTSGHDVPLALSEKLSPESLNFLDELGVVLLGHIRRLTYGEILDFPRIGQQRADEIWAAREELWLRWKKAKASQTKKKKRSHTSEGIRQVQKMRKAMRAVAAQEQN